VAAAAIAAVFVVQIAIRKPPTPEAMSTTIDQAAKSEPVATLIFAELCRWEASTGNLLEGARLPRRRLHLQEGFAVLRFDGGAEVILAGDVELELASQGSARLHRGQLTVKVPEEAVGFTVQTPSGDMVDLGTEFAVDVDKKGATELYVLDGAVEHRQPADRPGTGQIFHSGQAVRYGPDATQPRRPVAMRPEPFNTLLRQANTRPREDRIWTYEGFNYPVGKIATESATGGAGWAGPWRLRQGAELNPRETDDSSGLHIAFQQMNVPWPVPGGRAGMLEMPQGNTYRVRPLAKPLDLGKDAVYYVSLMVQEEDCPDERSQTPRFESVRFTFRSSQAYWGDRIAFGLSTNRKPHIEVADSLRFTTPNPIPSGQTMLWVAKINARRDGEDEVFFRVYQEGETLDLVEPAQWSVSTRGLRSDAKLDLVLLTSTGSPRRWFDELRIGTNWRAIVPVVKPTTVSTTLRESPADEVREPLEFRTRNDHE
jgi:hypothetical protein